MIAKHRQCDRDTSVPTLANPADPAPSEPEAHVRDLLAMLTALHDSLRQLVELADRKLAAMRIADTEALQRCTAEEGRLLQAVFARERQRDAILARLAQDLPQPGGGPAELSEIADRLAEPSSSRLQAKIAGLCQTATALREKNRLAATVARNLHAHVRTVFDDVANANRESVVYGPNGKHEQRNPQTWVDAVG